MMRLLCTSAIVATAATAGAQSNAAATEDGKVLGTLIYADLDVGFEGHTAGEAFRFISKMTGVPIRVLAMSNTQTDGIDPDNPITIEQADRPALNLLQEVLAQCEPIGDCTWQVRHGAFEVSTKSRLSVEGLKSVKILPVEDLLIEIPDFNDPPNLNLGGAGGGEGGGGGGGGGFGGAGGGGGGGGGGGAGGAGGGIYDYETLAERMDELIHLITTNVERQAWERNGGSWASIQPYRRTIVVRAPRWIHRQVSGFDYPIIAPAGRGARELRQESDRITVLVPLSEQLRKQSGE